MDVNDVRSLLTVVTYLKKETKGIISNMYINHISINMVTLGTNGVLLVLLSRFEELRERALTLLCVTCSEAAEQMRGR